MQTQTEAAERVARGVEWLDRHRPDWRSRITLPEFDIESTCNCVIGQVFAQEAAERNTGKVFSIYSGWSTGMYAALGNDYDSVRADAFAIRHGFDSGQGVTYGELQAAWERVLREQV